MLEWVPLTCQYTLEEHIITLLLPSIRLLYPDHGRPETTDCQPHDWVWPPGHQQVGAVRSVLGVRRSWEVSWLQLGLSKQLLPGNRCSP